MTQAYPLAWPAGWPRTDRPQNSRFTSSNLASEVFTIKGELLRLGGRDVVVSTNITLRRDGIPYSNQRRPDDCGVAAFFTLNGRQQCIPCDRWSTVEENARAIWKSIDALRGLERWGAKAFVDAAFAGFVALPPPGVDWRSVLGSEIRSLDAAEMRYRHLAVTRHPDQPGGSTEMMAELNAAIIEARSEFA